MSSNSLTSAAMDTDLETVYHEGDPDVKKSVAALLKNMKVLQSDNVQSYLKKFDRPSRRKLVYLTVGRANIVFLTIKNGDNDLWNYIINECDVDVEQTILVQDVKSSTGYPQFKAEARPLWVAALYGRTAFAESLLQRGANVNAKSSVKAKSYLGLTAADVACTTLNIELLMILLKAGSQVSSPKGSFFRRIIKDREAVKALIESGFDIDIVDRNNNTLICTAISSGRYATVVLLLDLGADIYRKCNYGETVLQAACTKGNKQIVELIMEKRNLEPAELIEAYELMGLSRIERPSEDTDDEEDSEDTDNTADALVYWEKAMKVREENTSVVTAYLPPHRAFHLVTEPKNLTELLELMQRPDGVFDYAMMLRERILGHFIHTVYLSEEIFSHVTERSKLGRGIDRMLYVCVRNKDELVGLVENTEKKSFEDLFAFSCLPYETRKTKILCRLQEDISAICQREEKMTVQEIREADALHWWFDAAMDVLTRVTRELEAESSENVDESASGDECNIGCETSNAWLDEHSQNFLIDIAAMLITFISKLFYANSEREASFRNLVRRLVLCPCNCNDGTTLFMTVLKLDCLLLEDIQLREELQDLRFEFSDADPVSPWKHSTQLMLECGADVRDTDDYRNTCLHICVQHLNGSLFYTMYRRSDTYVNSKPWFDALSTTSELHDMKSLIQLLLDHGAHADATNDKREVAIDGIGQCLTSDFSAFDYVTLKCLAARVIKEQKIPFSKEDIPANLIGFLWMH